jgi:hypothetical protein
MHEIIAIVKPTPNNPGPCTKKMTYIVEGNDGRF